MNLARIVSPARMIAVCAAAALVTCASTAGAFNLRAPQVLFCNASLQAYLNANDGGVNTLTDQLDAQVWQTSVSGNATFTLMIELAGNATQNSIGVYNTLDAVPALDQVFPGAATAGWFATCHFTSTGTLKVLLYDDTATPQGTTTYTGVDRTHFGFYLQGPGGTFYSQDGRNGGNPQILTYAGTGQNYGDWWECFEDLPFGGSCATDYEDAVCLLQSVVPTPTHNKSWGSLKAGYR
jgi:hypothetical protein